MSDDNAVIAAAATSPLLHYHWLDRGQAPPGYIKGMAAACAESLRLLKSGDRSLLAITAPESGQPAQDLLNWYATELKACGAAVEHTEDRLVAILGRTAERNRKVS
jgi:hypothetical protein